MKKSLLARFWAFGCPKAGGRRKGNINIFPLCRHDDVLYKIHRLKTESAWSLKRA